MFPVHCNPVGPPSEHTRGELLWTATAHMLFASSNVAGDTTPGGWHERRMRHTLLLQPFQASLPHRTRGQLDHFTWPPILALSTSAHSLSRNHLEDSNFFTEIHPPHAVTNSKIERIDSEVNSPWVHLDITFKQKPKSQELTQEVKVSNGHYKPEY